MNLFWNDKEAVVECNYQTRWLVPFLCRLFYKIHIKSEKIMSKPNVKTSVNESGHEKMCLMSYANIKGADQPAHLHSLISAFVVRWLDSLISLDSIAETSRL